MAIDRILNEVIGKRTNVNRLDPRYKTALIRGSNVFTRKGGTYENRRGFGDYGTGLSSSDNILQFLEFKDRLLVHQDDNKLYYDSNGTGTFVAYTGTFEAIANYKLKGLKANGSLFVTDKTGLKKIQSLTSAPIKAGVPKAVDFELSVIASPPALALWLPDATTVSYRITYSYYDENDYLVTGAPSQRQEISNIIPSVNVSGCADNGAGLIRVTTAVQSFTTGDSVKIEDVVGTTEANNVWTITVIDTTHIDLQSSAFVNAYVSGGTVKEGDLNRAVNIKAYLPEGITTRHFYEIFRSSQVAVGILPPGDFKKVYEGQLTSTDISNGYFDIDDNSPDDFRIGDLYTNSDQEGNEQENNEPPLCVDMDRHKNYTIMVNIEGKQRSYLNLITTESMINNDTIVIGGITCTGKTAAPGAGEFLIHNSLSNDLGSVSLNVEGTAKNVIECFNGHSSNGDYYAYYFSSYDDVPGKILIESRDAGGVKFYIIGTAGDCFSPEFPTSGTVYGSDSDKRINGIQWSKSNQIEHCPIMNRQSLGDDDNEIYAIKNTGESTFFIAKNGIYRLAGTSPPFDVIEFDMTVKCQGRNSVVKADGKVFLYTNKGAGVLTNVGFLPISDDVYEELTDSQINNNQEKKVYGMAYESENMYILSKFKDGDSSENDIVETYNYKYGSWIDFNIPFECSATVNNIMYYAKQSSSNLYKERKSNSNSDYRDPDLSVTINVIDSNNNTVEFSSVIDLELDSFIVQGVNKRRILEKISDIKYRLITVNNLTPGSADVWVGIQAYIGWTPSFGNDGMQTVEKSAQKIHILFDDAQTEITNAQILTKTDINRVEIITNLLGDDPEYWGKKWGIVWGTKVTRGSSPPMPLPSEHQRFRLLYVAFQHRVPLEKFVNTGYGIDFDAYDTRHTT